MGFKNKKLAIIELFQNKLSGTSIGLDIGNDSIKFVKLKKIGKSYSLLSYGMILPKERELDPSEALKILLKNEKNSIPIYTNVSGSGVFIQSFTLSHLPESKLKDTVKLASQKYVSMPIEQTNIAFKEIGEIEERNQKKKKVILIAAEKKLIEEKLEAFKKAGLEVEGITGEPFAYWNLMKFINPDCLNFTIIDIGKESTQIAIFQNNILSFVREIITSGHSINESIKNLDNKKFDELPELLIKKYGLLKENKKEIIDAIIPIIERLISEIERTFSYYKQKNPGFSIDRIYLAGGTAMLPGFLEFLKERIRYDISILNPFEKADITFSLQDQTKLIEQGPLYSQAIGLALETKERLDLLPDEIKQNKLLSKIYPILGFSIFLLIFILSILYLNLNNQYKTNLRILNSLKSRTNNTSLSPLTPIEIKKKVERFKIIKETIDRLERRKKFEISLFTEITDIIPEYIMLESLSIGNLEIEQDAGKATPFEIQGFVWEDEINLEVGLFQFKKILDSTTFIKNLKILSKEKNEVNGKKVLRFTFLCEINE